jgi:WXG100 family type VII secretion target
MADGTTTSTPQMAAFQTKATDAATRISGMLTKLLGDLQQLEGHWLGQGGTSFVQTKATVQTETTKLHNALTGIAADVGTAGTNYAAADSDQKSTMDNVNSQASGITAALRA